MTIAVAVVLAVIGIGLLWYGQRLWRALTEVGPAKDEPAAEPAWDEAVTAGPVGPDELVFLFPGRFVGIADDDDTTPGRTGTAPLTDEAVDLRNQANRLLYAILVDQYRRDRIELRLVEQAPSMMPPFPNKGWMLEVRRADALTTSPLLDCLNVAFNIIYRQREPQNEEGEQLWVALDKLLEETIKVARAEISFWQRQGVYGDFCNYVQEALVARGYMRQRPRNTWLERLRSPKLDINREAIEERRPTAEQLHERLVEFRRQYGSEQTQQVAEDLTNPTEDANEELSRWSRPLDEMPLDDALRISIYEALHCLRQLEPSGGA